MVKLLESLMLQSMFTFKMYLTLLDYNIFISILVVHVMLIGILSVKI